MFKTMASKEKPEVVEEKKEVANKQDQKEP